MKFSEALQRLFKLRRTSLPSGTEPEPASAENPEHQVAGERGISSVNRRTSIQSRVTNGLAFGLMAMLGVGLLAWYYTNALGRSTTANATNTATTKAQGEMTLPPLGPIDPPQVGSPNSATESLLGEPPPAPPQAVDESLLPHTTDPEPVYAANYGSSGKNAALDRRLSGDVLTSSSAAPISTGQDDASKAEYSQASSIQDAGAPDNAASLDTRRRGGLEALLTPSTTPSVRAQVLPTQRLLLAKGSFLDCTLETAIDSSLPGMTTCITATDTFGVDGSVVLLERGSKLVGETKGDVRQGSSRLFVLWTEARTPTGVVIALASPGTDELGRSGLEGEVNRHFWERFGAAILVSVIDGAVQAAIQRSGDGHGAVIVNPSTSTQIMTEVLESTINIPPTVTKRNGDRIQVLVARDLDFRSVYELRPTFSRGNRP